MAVHAMTESSNVAPFPERSPQASQLDIVITGLKEARRTIPLNLIARARRDRCEYLIVNDPRLIPGLPVENVSIDGAVRGLPSWSVSIFTETDGSGLLMISDTRRLHFLCSDND